MKIIRTGFAMALITAFPLLVSVEAAATPLAQSPAVVVADGTQDLPFEFEAVAGKRFNDGEDRAAAQSLGYAEAKVGRSHGCLIFKHSKKNLYISQDLDGHNGGRWKMASSPERLASKDTRMGTYDENLNRIGD